MPSVDPHRLPPRLRGPVEVLEALVVEWRADRVGGLAAEVSFYAILSVFPGLLAVAALLGSIDPLFGAEVAGRVRADVLDALTTVLDLERGGTTYEAFEGLFDESSAGLLTVGLLAALWAMSRGFASLVKALDVAYDLEEHRPWLRLRLLAVGLSAGSVVVGAAVLTMIVVGPLLGAGAEVADVVGLGDAFATWWDWFRLPVTGLVLTAWLATIFHVAPNHRTPWRADVPGAVAAAVLALAASAGFRAYLEVAGAGNEVFGALGSAISLLLWLHLISLSVIVGGELNAILWLRRGEDPAEAPAPDQK